MLIFIVYMVEVRKLKSVALAIPLMLMLAVPFLIVLAMLFGGGLAVWEKGREFFDAESYWTEQVAKSDDRLQRLSASASACKGKADEGIEQLAQLYGDLLQKGWSQKEAMDWVLVSQSVLKHSCLEQLSKFILELRTRRVALTELKNLQ